MDEDAYRQYDLESDNWLHRGRLSLLSRLLRETGLSHRRAKLLEVGAGVGQNIPVLAEFGDVDAAEIDDLGIARLRAIDALGHIYTDPIPFDYKRSYDVICALDVIEHLSDDQAALDWMASGLTAGGYLVASVPAYQWLFSDHDRALGHHRRYTKRRFLRLLRGDMEAVRAGYFVTSLLPFAAVTRALGGARRRLFGTPRSVQKQRAVMPPAIDRLLYRVLDVEARQFSRRPLAPFGLSIFVVARKRHTGASDENPTSLRGYSDALSP